VGSAGPEWSGARDEGDVLRAAGEERLLGDGWRRRSHWDRLPEGWGEMVTLRQRRVALQRWARQWLDAVLVFGCVCARDVRCAVCGGGLRRGARVVACG